MHKDQERIQKALLPRIMDRALAESPEAERDCTVLNRLLIQGPDPLFLMEALPDAFERICAQLRLTPTQGREAIEGAHWRGPSVLIGNTAAERLWLILAGCSDCTEQGYGDETSFLERVQRAARAVGEVAHVSLQREDALIRRASETYEQFAKTTAFVRDDRGFVHTDQDHGFYLAYTMGEKVCAVHTSGPTFWGTTDTTSLEAEGITVSKQISPQFGLVFDDSPAEWARLRGSQR